MSSPIKKAGNKRPADETLETTLSTLAPDRTTTDDTKIKLVILTSDVLLDGRRAVISTIRKLFAAEKLTPSPSDGEILAALSKGPRLISDIFVELGLFPKPPPPAGPTQSLVPSTPTRKWSDSAPTNNLPSASFHVLNMPKGRIPSTSPTARRNRPAESAEAVAKRTHLLHHYTEIIIQEPYTLYKGVREFLARLHAGGLRVLVITQHPSMVCDKIRLEDIPRDHIEAILDSMHDYSLDPIKSRRIFSERIAPIFGLSLLPGDVYTKKENKTDEDEDMKDAPAERATRQPITPPKLKRDKASNSPNENKEDKSEMKPLPLISGTATDQAPTTPRAKPVIEIITPSTNATPAKIEPSESKGKDKQGDVQPQTPSRNANLRVPPFQIDSPTPTKPQAPTPTQPAPPAHMPDPAEAAAYVAQQAWVSNLLANSINPKNEVKIESENKMQNHVPKREPVPQAEVIFASCTPKLCACMGKAINARTYWVNNLTSQATVAATGVDPAQFDHVVGDLFQLADEIVGKEEEKHGVDAMDVDGPGQGFSAVEMVLPGNSDSAEEKGHADAASMDEFYDAEEDHEMGDGDGSTAVATATAVPVATPTASAAVDSATATAAPLPFAAALKSQAVDDSDSDDSEVIYVYANSW